MATPRIAETRPAAFAVWLFRTAALVAMAIAPLQLAFAQAELPPPSLPAHGMNLPSVPTRDPRSLDGDWAPKNDQPPLPTFIETLKGNDAAIEVGVGQGRLLTTKHPVQSGGGHSLHRRRRSLDRRFRSAAQSANGPHHRQAAGRHRSLGHHGRQPDLQLRNPRRLRPGSVAAQLKQMFPDADVRLAQIGAEYRRRRPGAIARPGLHHHPDRSGAHRRPAGTERFARKPDQHHSPAQARSCAAHAPAISRWVIQMRPSHREMESCQFPRPPAQRTSPAAPPARRKSLTC